MSRHREFEPGDIVAVVGGKLTENLGVRSITPSVKVAKVLFVGMRDLIVEELQSFYSSTFITKKSRCSPVQVKPEFASHPTPEPARLGDMVLHHKGTRYGKVDVNASVGILMEISHEPGSKPRGSILVAEELVDVELGDVMVLQRKDEK